LEGRSANGCVGAGMRSEMVGDKIEEEDKDEEDSDEDSDETLNLEDMDQEEDDLEVP
jgi:hypothetical protein